MLLCILMFTLVYLQIILEKNTILYLRENFKLIRTKKMKPIEHNLNLTKEVIFR